MNLIINAVQKYGNVQQVSKQPVQKPVSEQKPPVDTFVKNSENNIEADIFEFLGYVKKAKYVVTATFHGSIFSIIFKKQFVSTVGNCLKIGDILERLNLGDRDITNIEKIESVIDRLIDYDEVEKLKLKYRKESMEYLEKAILNGEKI